MNRNPACLGRWGLAERTVQSEWGQKSKWIAVVVAIVMPATMTAGIFKALTMNKVLHKTLFHKPAHLLIIVIL